MQHFQPSFERRICFLVGLFVLLTADYFGSWQDGVFMALMAVFGGEIFLLIFGPAYAIDTVPFAEGRDPSPIDFVLHPVASGFYGLVVGLALVFDYRFVMLAIVVLIASLLAAAVYLLRTEEGPAAVDEPTKPDPVIGV